MFQSVARLYTSMAMTTTVGIGMSCYITSVRDAMNAFVGDTTNVRGCPESKVFVSAALSGAVWPLTLYDVFHERYPLEPFRLLPEPWNTKARTAYLDHLKSE